MELTKIKTLWPEEQSFHLIRPSTRDQSIFLHFLTPVVIVSADGKATRVREGGCIVYTPNSYQEFYPDGCPLVHNWFHIKGDLSELLDKYSLVGGEVYYPADDSFITKLLQSIELEKTRNDLFANEVIMAKLNELFAKIARNCSNAHTPLPDSDTVRIFRAFRAKMQSEYALKWDIDTMAANTNLSRSRFNVLYRAIFKTSPKSDLISIRIEHAKLMLANTGYSVSDIAEKTGFSDEFNFIRRFKNSTGMTPGAYRANKTK